MQNAKALAEFKLPLEKAKNRGSFSGLDQLFDELHEVATEFSMQGLVLMLEKIKDANQAFDIEETQKMMSKILSGIEELGSINMGEGNKP